MLAQPRPPGRIDKADVDAAIEPRDVLAHFGVDARRAGGELWSRSCPGRADRSRDEVGGGRAA